MQALRLGVRYCDTAPAYQQSQDYYGEAFRVPGKAARDALFLASKTHERTRDRALRLLDDSLRRLGTDRLDLWQMHDLRDMHEIDVLTGKGGALEAAAEAKRDGRIRFVGLTGHHDPEVLREAMRRFPFDSLLVAINPADPRYRPFLSTAVAEARRNVRFLQGLTAARTPRSPAPVTATSGIRPGRSSRRPTARGRGARRSDRPRRPGSRTAHRDRSRPSCA